MFLCYRNTTSKPQMGCCMWSSGELLRAISQLSWPTMMLGSTVSKLFTCAVFFVCVCAYKSSPCITRTAWSTAPSVSKHWPMLIFPFLKLTRELCNCVLLHFDKFKEQLSWSDCVIRGVFWVPADCSVTDHSRCETWLMSGGRWSQHHLCYGAGADTGEFL